MVGTVIPTLLIIMALDTRQYDLAILMPSPTCGRLYVLPFTTPLLLLPCVALLHPATTTSAHLTQFLLHTFPLILSP